MSTILTLPLIGSLAAVVGIALGFRGPVCGTVIGIAAATVWSLS